MLGPNGAGKTTTVNVLTTLMKADAGTVRVAGYDVMTGTRQVRSVIGVTGQFAAVDELLSGQENLQLMADLKRVRSADRVVARLLERFDLAESAQKMVATYSGGMRRTSARSNRSSSRATTRSAERTALQSSRKISCGLPHQRHGSDPSSRRN